MLNASSGLLPPKGEGFRYLNTLCISSVVSPEILNFRSDAKREASECYLKRYIMVLN